jgi:hypothetical protein
VIWHLNVTLLSKCGERVTLFKTEETPHSPIVGDRVVLPFAIEIIVTSRKWSFHLQEPILECWCTPAENIERQQLLDLIFGALDQRWSAYDLTPGILADSKQDPRAIRTEA